METRHNYDAVNAAIAQQQQNAFEELRQEQASRWSLYGGTAIKFAIAAAILIFVLSLAWWLFNERVYNSASNGTVATTSEQGIVEVIKNAPTETSTGAKISSEFVIFHTVDNADGSAVNTGWTYKPEDIEKPYKQYCYWTKTSGSDSNKSERVNIGQTDDSGKIVWNNVDAKYKKHQKDCQFGRPEISATTGATTPGAQVFEKIWRSVVYIKSGDAQGSGVIVGASRVATNCHVIENGNVHVYPPHNRETTAKNGIRAMVIRRDNERDFCLLRVSNISGQVASIRKFNTLQIGETVYALGAPQGLELTLTSGLLSQLRRNDNKRRIQTNAAISPGSSGGGLFDQKGNLIGITTSGIEGDGAQGLNFAIPADLALR